MPSTGCDELFVDAVFGRCNIASLAPKTSGSLGIDINAITKLVEIGLSCMASLLHAQDRLHADLALDAGKLMQQRVGKQPVRSAFPRCRRNSKPSIGHNAGSNSYRRTAAVAARRPRIVERIDLINGNKIKDFSHWVVLEVYPEVSHLGCSPLRLKTIGALEAGNASGKPQRAAERRPGRAKRAAQAAARQKEEQDARPEAEAADKAERQPRLSARRPM